MELPEHVSKRLEEPNFWHLATVNPDGSPQSTTVWVDVRDGKILVNTALGRKKPRNLEREPRVALSWHGASDSGYESFGVQGRVVDSTPVIRRRRTSTRWRRSTSASRRIRGGAPASSGSASWSSRHTSSGWGD